MRRFSVLMQPVQLPATPGDHWAHYRFPLAPEVDQALFAHADNSMLILVFPGRILGPAEYDIRETPHRVVQVVLHIQGDSIAHDGAPLSAIVLIDESPGEIASLKYRLDQMEERLKQLAGLDQEKLTRLLRALERREEA